MDCGSSVLAVTFAWRSHQSAADPALARSLDRPASDRGPPDGVRSSPPRGGTRRLSPTRPRSRRASQRRASRSRRARRAEAGAGDAVASSVQLHPGARHPGWTFIATVTWGGTLAPIPPSDEAGPAAVRPRRSRCRRSVSARRWCSSFVHRERFEDGCVCRASSACVSQLRRRSWSPIGSRLYRLHASSNPPPLGGSVKPGCVVSVPDCHELIGPGDSLVHVSAVGDAEPSRFDGNRCATCSSTDALLRAGRRPKYGVEGRR